MIESQWDTEEAVPDWAKEHVKRTDDGKALRLEVRNMVPGKVHDEFRNNNRNLHKQVEELTGKISERENWVNPEEHAQLQEQLKSVPSAEEVQTLKRQLAASNQQYTTTLNERDSARREIDTLHIRSAVSKAAGEAGILPSAVEDVQLRAATTFKRDNGQIVAVNSEGNPRFSSVKPTEPLTPERWMQEELKPSAGHLFKRDSGINLPDFASGIPANDNHAVSANLEKIASGEAKLIHEE